MPFAGAFLTVLVTSLFVGGIRAKAVVPAAIAVSVNQIAQSDAHNDGHVRLYGQNLFDKF